MPSTPPEGDPVPVDGSLPASAAIGSAQRRFGVYLHIPFCAVRCGYCDFNTYTAAELGGGGSQAEFAGFAVRELDLAAKVMAGAGVAPRAASTVFAGGGTPTLLPATDLVRMLDAVRSNVGLAPGAEATFEANPDSVTAESLAELAAAGFTRVSFGMQSAVPRVLAVLDRTHDPERVPQAVGWARDAGLAVSLDLIYGTPGESLADWRLSVEAALACAPDHLSAYALVIEDGTRMAGRVRRGEFGLPDDDDLADKYELADDLLTRAGLSWYEVSNWAREPNQACAHNVGYWHGDDWWGIGPGAHSHVGGVRWWNVRHPAAYAQRLSAGQSPAQAREVLDAAQRRDEQVLLGVRLAGGFAIEHPALPGLAADGLVQPGPAAAGRVVLTRRGRLLADGVVRTLLS